MSGKLTFLKPLIILHVENDLFTELSVKAELYNQKFDKVPTILQRLVGSEQIAGKIKLENGEMLYVTLLMRGGKVGKFYRYDTPTDSKLKVRAFHERGNR